MTEIIVVKKWNNKGKQEKQEKLFEARGKTISALLYIIRKKWPSGAYTKGIHYFRDASEDITKGIDYKEMKIELPINTDSWWKKRFENIYIHAKISPLIQKLLNETN